MGTMKTLLAVLLLACSLVAQIRLRDVDAARRELRPWLDALAKVESNCDDQAVGDGGKAIGRFQIWRVYWADAVERCRALRDARYEDVTERVYAERIIVAYMLRYCPEAVASKDWEHLSRTHNGGPRGASKDATLGYWRKVNRALQEQQPNE
jgi:hypothetical protein